MEAYSQYICQRKPPEEEDYQTLLTAQADKSLQAYIGYTLHKDT